MKLLILTLQRNILASLLKQLFKWLQQRFWEITLSIKHAQGVVWRSGCFTFQCYSSKFVPQWLRESVRIRSYSGPYFPAFGLNTERCSVSIRIQSECGKGRTKITPNTDTSYAMLLWMFSTIAISRKISIIYKRELRAPLNDKNLTFKSI